MSVRTWLLSPLIALAVTLAAAPIAHAGTYPVYGCQTPTGGTAPMDHWSFSPDVNRNNIYDYWADECPGRVRMWMSATHWHPDGDVAEATFNAPANTTIASYTLTRAVRVVSQDGYYYQAWDLSAGQWHLVDGCPRAANCGDIGDYTNHSAASDRFTHVAESGTTEIALKLVCGNGNGCPAEPGGTSASLELFQSVISLEDNYAPQLVGTPTGPLVTPGALLSGIVPVSLAATDRGGGVYDALVEVDGRVIQTQALDGNGGLCQSPFLVAAPCLGSASGTLYVDTRALADGAHSLVLLVGDPAGNLTTWGPITIETINSPCSPFPAAGGLQLQSRFAVVVRRRERIRKRVRIVRQVRLVDHLNADFLQRPTVLGRLLTTAGQPVGDAPVCVAAQTNLPGAPLRVVGELNTGGSGVFSHRLAPGPSRTIYFIHRVLGGAVYDAVTITVRVPVRVHVQHRTLHNGQVMTWTGHLPGPVPPGLLALMQVSRGSYWQTFEQVAVAPKGGWIGRYRFRLTTGVQRYRFRLLVPHQAGYPYAANASAPFTETVIG